jgi:hypothetical protein
MEIKETKMKVRKTPTLSAIWNGLILTSRMVETAIALRRRGDVSHHGEVAKGERRRKVEREG